MRLTAAIFLLFCCFLDAPISAQDRCFVVEAKMSRLRLTKSFSSFSQCSGLKGKHAVVTGGAQGLGLALSHRLVANGAHVTLWDMDAVELKNAKDALLAVHPHSVVKTVEVDVTNAIAVEAASLHGADILVCSAGITGGNYALKDYPIDEWKRVLDINLNGVFLCNRYFIPHMMSQGYGRIVNVSSVAGKEGNPNASAYSASKAGVIALTKSVAKETATCGNISVNCVTPAAARTRIFDQMTPAHIQYMLSKIPRNRFLEVDEFASMVTWLVSSENSFTTGAVFDLSGGRATY
jgi:2-dehydro-3-deoxy-L-rhamnonate dehydrogenase (NAD+)